jgi:hypothetical protein
MGDDNKTGRDDKTLARVCTSTAHWCANWPNCWPKPT